MYTRQLRRGGYTVYIVSARLLINELGAGDAQQLRNYMIGLSVGQGLLINFPSFAKNDTAPADLEFIPLPARPLALAGLPNKSE